MRTTKSRHFWFASMLVAVMPGCAGHADPSSDEATEAQLLAMDGVTICLSCEIAEAQQRYRAEMAARERALQAETEARRRADLVAARRRAEALARITQCVETRNDAFKAAQQAFDRAGHDIVSRDSLCAVQNAQKSCNATTRAKQVQQCVQVYTDALSFHRASCVGRPPPQPVTPAQGHAYAEQVARCEMNYASARQNVRSECEGAHPVGDPQRLCSQQAAVPCAARAAAEESVRQQRKTKAVQGATLEFQNCVGLLES